VRFKAIGLNPTHFVQLFEVRGRRGGGEGGEGVVGGRRSGCSERHYIYYRRKGKLNGSVVSQPMPARSSDKERLGQGRDLREMKVTSEKII
jgi:hypothetical protein